MTLNEYQQKAMTTRMETCNNFSYMMLNLVGEVGEFASKMAKHIRKDELEINKNHINGVISNEQESELRKEAGDIAWLLVGLCNVMGWKFQDVCQENLDKLASRQKRHVIDGDGDNR